MSDKKRYWRVVWIAMLLPVVFALLDLGGAAMWRMIGGWNGDPYVTAQHAYQGLFWLFAYVVILGIAITYYLTTRDKSESIALALIPFILLQMGAEDVFFYFLGGHELWTVTLPWLTENLWAPTLLSWTFGEPVITGPIIIVSAVLGYFISIALAQELVKIKG